jgi:hypothetical protein
MKGYAMFSLVWFLVCTIIGGTMFLQLWVHGDVLMMLCGMGVMLCAPIGAYVDMRFNHFIYYGLPMVRVYGVNAESEI